MKKKLLIILTLVLAMAVSVPAFAAITGLTDAQKSTITDKEKQITELRKQIVDEYAKAGQITSEQAKTIKENIDNAQQYREENGIVGGPGMGRGGCGLGGGVGGGCGAGGCGGAGFNGNTQNTQNVSI